MSKHLAIFFSGFFLITACSAQEACQLDEAMSIWNDDAQMFVHLLFRGSRMYKVETKGSAHTFRFLGNFPITDYWGKWNKEKITRTMSWFNSNKVFAVIGDNETSHFTQFDIKHNEFKAFPNIYKIWPGDSLKEFAVAGISPSRGVFLGNMEPNFLWFYFDDKKSANWSYMSINLASNDSHFSKLDSVFGANQKLKTWLDRFISTNFKMIGMLTTTWSFGGTFVVFIEHKQTMHCFTSLVSQHFDIDCTMLIDYQVTNKALFGCDKTDELSTFELSTSEMTSTTETTTIDDKPEQTNWTLIFTAAGFVFLFASCCIAYSQANKQDHNGYELVKTSPTSPTRFIPHFRGQLSSDSQKVSSGSENEDKSSAEMKKKKKRRKSRSRSNFKPRRARDLMGKWSESLSCEEKQKKSGSSSKVKPRRAKDLMDKFSESSGSEKEV